MERFVQVFLSPIEMIDTVRNRPDFWMPILAMLLLHTAVSVLHVALVDHGYFVADVMGAQGVWMSQDQAELARQAVDRAGPTMVLASQATVLFGYLITLPVWAGYLSLVARIAGNAPSFRHWLGIVGWVSVIGALSILARAVSIIAAPEGRLGFHEANPMSLSSILGRDFPSMTIAQFDITNVWRWGLLCLAYKRWTKASWALSTPIILLPVLIIYGTAAMLSF